MKTLSYLIVFFYLTLGQIVFAQNTNEKTGPGTYEILSNIKEPVKIPFKMHHGKPIMELKINGEPAVFMIDNGILWDEVWLFGTPIVEKINLKPIETGTIAGAGEGDATTAYTSSNLTLAFKDIIFYEQPVYVSPYEAGFASMFPGTDGQLCNAFFKHFIVEFDFEENFVILHNPKEFKYEGNGSILDMTLNESGTHAVPFSFTTLDGKIYNDKADIDFGGVYEFKVALNNKHNLQLPKDVKPVRAFGAQGEMNEYKGKIKNMTFGKYTFEDPTVVFGDERTARIHPDNLGVIGLPMFMKFDIIFDYFNYKIYIEPNRDFNGTIE